MSSPKPIQMRLPKGVEDSLRYLKDRTGRTINSIVIDCLKENLPTVPMMDLRNTGEHDCKTPQEIKGQLLKYAAAYRGAKQKQLDAAIDLVNTLNKQTAAAHSMHSALADDILLSDLSGEFDTSYAKERELSKELVQHQCDSAQQFHELESLYPYLVQSIRLANI